MWFACNLVLQLGHLGRCCCFLAEHNLDDHGLQVRVTIRAQSGFVERVNQPALPEDRDAVSNGQCLAQLVGDEDDGDALPLQTPQHCL